ncbi:MAG TPA: hypothetical protein VH796_05640 [Nitrososphaeraceae archaeon]|jgi:hypothetical protein
MVRISKIKDGIPAFVKDYLELKDTDDLIWDENLQDGVKFFRVIKKDADATTSSE